MAEYTYYTRPSVNANNYGAYSSLANYNQSYYGRGITVPIPATTIGMETVIIPGSKSLGYGKLASCVVDEDHNSNYLSINNAYPNYSNNCNKFTSRLC